MSGLSALFAIDQYGVMQYFERTIIGRTVRDRHRLTMRTTFNAAPRRGYLIFFSSAPLFDHLVCKRQHRWGNLNTKHLGGPQIKTEVKLWTLDQNIADLFSPQNFINKISTAVPQCGEIHAVRQQ